MHETRSVEDYRVLAGTILTGEIIMESEERTTESVNERDGVIVKTQSAIRSVHSPLARTIILFSKGREIAPHAVGQCARTVKKRL